MTTKSDAKRVDLKRALMNVGNRLVTEFGYNPGKDERTPSTKPIVEFTEWLNRDENARFLLEQEGVDWPIVRR